VSKILVIDDEKMILQMLDQVLTKFGHDVETAADGIEGICKFSNGRFDLVITDARMPGQDGNSVVRYIRSSDKHFTPIIGMSGTPWLLNGDFNTVLAKPFPTLLTIYCIISFL